ncbi:MAG: hypothetical protein ACTSVK_15935 [Promethearchaeota archaeon]
MRRPRACNDWIVSNPFLKQENTPPYDSFHLQMKSVHEKNFRENMENPCHDLKC